MVRPHPMLECLVQVPAGVLAPAIHYHVPERQRVLAQQLDQPHSFLGKPILGSRPWPGQGETVVSISGAKKINLSLPVIPLFKSKQLVNQKTTTKKSLIFKKENCHKRNTMF